MRSVVLGIQASGSFWRDCPNKRRISHYSMDTAIKRNAYLDVSLRQRQYSAEGAAGASGSVMPFVPGTLYVLIDNMGIPYG
jgi:hypothetical protein